MCWLGGSLDDENGVHGNVFSAGFVPLCVSVYVFPLRLNVVR